MKFFGAGIGRAEDLLQFFLGHNYDATIERHCPQAKEWISHMLRSVGRCTSTMTQLLLWLYSILHREQISVHLVHIADLGGSSTYYHFWGRPCQMDCLLCSISTFEYFPP